MTPGGDELQFDWRRGGAAAGALIAALILLAMVVLVAMSNQARDAALDGERHAYDVEAAHPHASTPASPAPKPRSAASSSTKRSRPAATSITASGGSPGSRSASSSGSCATDPEQRAARRRAAAALPDRGAGARARRARDRRQAGPGGTGYFYQAGAVGRPATELDGKLDEIAASRARSRSRQRMEQSQFFSAEADRLTDYLSWLGVIVGLGAIFLGVVAVQALRQIRLRPEAGRDRDRARRGARGGGCASAPSELREANQALKAEADEREAAEAQLRQVQKMEAVGQLTGGIAHDFNNMLAVVVGGIDLARRRLNGPRREVLDHLNNAMEGATRAAALTRRLLSFARSEPLLPERVDSRELVAGMSDLLDRTLGERIQVEVDLAPDAWPIYVDPHQLENAIVNLAVNARDAMDGAGHDAHRRPTT